MLYVTGDFHGEMQRFHASVLRHLGADDELIICGDFGFLWNGGESEQKDLKKIGKLKYKVLFLDGTHENFDLLNAYPVEEWNGGKVQHISGGLYHLMRGQVYELEGKTLFTFGGGESAEKQLRMKAGKWWACELPNMEEMREGVSNLWKHKMQVDYIFTHEPPPNTGCGTLSECSGRKNQLDAYFGQIMKQVRYQKWFFGSEHVDRKITYKHYAVFSDVIPVEDIPPKKHRFRK